MRLRDPDSAPSTNLLDGLSSRGPIHFAAVDLRDQYMNQHFTAPDGTSVAAPQRRQYRDMVDMLRRFGSDELPTLDEVNAACEVAKVVETGRYLDDREASQEEQAQAYEQERASLMASMEDMKGYISDNEGLFYQANLPSSVLFRNCAVFGRAHDKAQSLTTRANILRRHPLFSQCEKELQEQITEMAAYFGGVMEYARTVRLAVDEQVKSMEENNPKLIVADSETENLRGRALNSFIERQRLFMESDRA